MVLIAGTPCWTAVRLSPLDCSTASIGARVQPVVGSARRGLHNACRLAVLRRGQAVHGAEGPAEVAWAGKTPPGRDGCDRAGSQRRIGKITAAALQPPLPDPARH